MRYTQEVITTLEEGEIFCFGSNESGHHGAGAALVARKKFGAVYGVGFGLQGNSFAIPTKDWSIRTLPIATVGFYVERFIQFARQRPGKIFLVTKLGTGLAGMTVEEIAPLFIKTYGLPNVVLPKEFVEVIESWIEKNTI